MGQGTEQRRGPGARPGDSRSDRLQALFPAALIKDDEEDHDDDDIALGGQSSASAPNCVSLWRNRARRWLDSPCLISATCKPFSVSISVEVNGVSGGGSSGGSG